MGKERWEERSLEKSLSDIKKNSYKKNSEQFEGKKSIASSHKKKQSASSFAQSIAKEEHLKN